MIIPIRAEGRKPPLFLLHGNTGFMPIGTTFSRVLGPDQPVYIINAKGFDGSEPRETVAEMASDYLADILSVTTTGPLVIVGQCWGTLIALEVASELLNRGCEMGPLILIDPPHVPFRKVPTEVTEETTRQLYDYTRRTLLEMSDTWYLELPFDANDAEQLHDAVITAMASITALSKFIPKPFFGSVELILNAESVPPFFGQGKPWQRILANPPVAHVLPYGHTEMLNNHRFDVGRLLGLILQWNEGRGTAVEPTETGFDEQQSQPERMEQGFSRMAGE
ncbi:MAG: alpha/beta fold hydrolase [Xanthobacteraceae bacterium]